MSHPADATDPPDFYRAFEDRYRGSRELVMSRLQVYKPFVATFLGIGSCKLALDLGCGRGEWLELTRQWGFDVRGVDVNDSMLEACRQRGLSVARADAVATLEALDDESVAVVSAFHLVEHIPFDDVRRLIRAARRVLCPGGILILETPNPENLVVGATSFYLDPTHIRPIPPPLLSFTTEHEGLIRNKILRLQESHDASNRLGLSTVLGGASPDYSVVSQKNGPAEVIARFNDVFAIEYGVSLQDLATQFDDQWGSALDARLSDDAERERRAEMRALHAENQLGQVEGRLLLADARRELAEKRVEIADQRAELAERRIEIAKARAEDAETRAATANELQLHAVEQAAIAQARTAQAEAQLKLLEEHIEAIHGSRSWKLTKPWRAVGRPIRRLISAISEDRVKSGLKRRIRAHLQALARGLQKAPVLRRAVSRSLSLVPSVKQRLAMLVSSAPDALGTQTPPPQSVSSGSSAAAWQGMENYAVRHLPSDQPRGVDARHQSPLEVLASHQHNDS